MKILVADDDRTNLDRAADVLSRLGHQVLEASDSDAAIRLARKGDGEVHLLLVNLELRDQKGLPLWRTLCDRHPEMLVVGMGASFDGGFPPSAEMLRKPLSLVELVMKVESVSRRLLEKG